MNHRKYIYYLTEDCWSLLRSWDGFKTSNDSMHAFWKRKCRQYFTFGSCSYYFSSSKTRVYNNKYFRTKLPPGSIFANKLPYETIVDCMHLNVILYCAIRVTFDLFMILLQHFYLKNAAWYHFNVHHIYLYFSTCLLRSVIHICTPS